MAVIHIPEAEAARDFARLLAQVHAGKEIRIDSGSSTIAMHRVPNANGREKTLSEAIRLAEERRSSVTLDDQFSRDLEAVICNHEHEGIRDPWAE